MNIIELLNVPTEKHDIGWLKRALQWAIQLELATIPPYLCAMWSIKSKTQYAYTSIHEIVVEEMIHLGLACNLLTTIGGMPKINTPDEVPKYPGGLPGGVKKGFTISLTAYSETQLKKFLEIEFPKHTPIELTAPEDEEFRTIGEFYDAIRKAFKKLQPSDFKGERQLSGDGWFDKILNLTDAENAIQKIQSQGEGTTMSPEEVENTADLAHFYRFREMIRGHKFIRNPDSTSPDIWIDDPDPLQLPTADGIYPMAEIPVGGYPEVSKEFDLIYTALLDTLQKAWDTNDDGIWNNAIYNLMTQLTEEARKLMQIPIDSNDLSRGTFGPSFLLVT